MQLTTRKDSIGCDYSVSSVGLRVFCGSWQAGEEGVACSGLGPSAPLCRVSSRKAGLSPVPASFVLTETSQVLRATLVPFHIIF